MAMLRAYNGTIETIISSKSDKSWYFLNCFVNARNSQVTFAKKKLQIKTVKKQTYNKHECKIHTSLHRKS